MKHLLKTVLILITALITVSCNAATTTTNNPDTGPVNYASNPGFESGLTGWSEIGGPGAGLVYITNVSTGGTQSAYILSTNTLDYTNSLVQYVAYQINKTYILSASMKDIIGPMKIMAIELCDTSSNSLSTPYTNLITSTGWSGWTTFTLTLAPTNISGFLRISFQVWKRSSVLSELYVDDVVLTNY